MWPLVVYFAFVVVLVAQFYYCLTCWGRDIPNLLPVSPMKVASFRKARHACVFPPVTTWLPMFFVIFDLEAVFLFAWAGAARQFGWAGYCEVLLFIGVLVAALIYL